MKLNSSKTHSITISRSRTSYFPLTLCGFDLEVCSSFKLLGVTLEDELTFEKHIRNLTSGLILKFYKTLCNDDAVFIPSTHLFLYCSSVWCFASDSHLKLLYRALNNIQFFLLDILINFEKFFFSFLLLAFGVRLHFYHFPVFSFW